MGLLLALVTRPGRLVLATPAAPRGSWDLVQRGTNYLRVHMANLRRKLEPDPSRPRYFITEPGMGYRYLNWTGRTHDGSGGGADGTGTDNQVTPETTRPTVAGWRSP